MSETNLSPKAKEALRQIRSWLMMYSQIPSVRELMNAMNYKSPRSAMLLMEELEENGFLEKRTDGSYRLIKNLSDTDVTRTVPIPLVGTVTCGIPILAEQNIEAMIPISTSLVRSGDRYFLLRAQGDSMDEAGINDGDLLLIKQQSTAYNGDKVVALIDDEATVKEFHRSNNIVRLIPRSSNPKYQQMIVTHDLQIQGVVVEIIPKINN